MQKLKNTEKQNLSKNDLNNKSNLPLTTIHSN